MQSETIFRAFPIQIFIIALCIGTGVGSSVLISRFLGEDKIEQAKKTGVFTKRSRVREHTKYKVATNLTLILALAVLAFSIMLSIDSSMAVTNLICVYLFSALMFVVSFMFLGKTILIRKIGVINKEENIFRIKDTINLEIK